MNKIAMAITTGAVITAVITLAALAYKNPDAVNTVKTKGKKILTRFKYKADDTVANVEVTAEQLADLLKGLRATPRN